MSKLVRRFTAVLALVMLFSSVGCKTYMVGQTLPSPNHGRDDLFYAGKGPQFPLARELNSMQAAEEEFKGNRP